ncbi:hypothetical protein MJT46_006399 [Ovis ammon polii x Ovis aries]|nr:hypothetical protein MJT46_006399 [Ovis ammon polii x Ovis aries]
MSTARTTSKASSRVTNLQPKESLTGDLSLGKDMALSRSSSYRGPAVPTGAHGVVYPRVMRVDWMQEQKEVMLENPGKPVRSDLTRQTLRTPHRQGQESQTCAMCVPQCNVLPPRRLSDRQVFPKCKAIAGMKANAESTEMLTIATAPVGNLHVVAYSILFILSDNRAQRVLEALSSLLQALDQLTVALGGYARPEPTSRGKALPPPRFPFQGRGELLCEHSPWGTPGTFMVTADRTVSFCTVLQVPGSGPASPELTTTHLASKHLS